MPKKKVKESAAEQSKVFIEKAREIGADVVVGADDDEVMRQLARQKRHQAEKGGKR